MLHPAVGSRSTLDFQPPVSGKPPIDHTFCLVENQKFSKPCYAKWCVLSLISVTLFIKSDGEFPPCWMSTTLMQLFTSTIIGLHPVHPFGFLANDELVCHRSSLFVRGNPSFFSFDFFSGRRARERELVGDGLSSYFNFLPYE